MDDWNAKIRYERALSQRIYIVESDDKQLHYKVMGTRDNTYNIDFTNASITCTCPDYLRNWRCKHIFYVLVKSFAIPKRNIFDSDADIYALIGKGATVIGENDVKQKSVVDDVCPICLDMLENEKVVFCRKKCGKNIHEICMDHFISYCLSGNKKVLCPFCRDEWET